MTEQTNPTDPGELDPEQFVGGAPAGDARPGDFISEDQSAPASGSQPDDEPDEPREAEK